MRNFATTLCCIGVLLLGFSGAALAQGVVTGTVVEDGTGDPLPGVSVFIPDLGTGAATDVDGQYTIENVPAGTYEIEARFIGYQTARRTVTVENGVTATVDFSLREGALRLEEVLVTGQGLETRRRSIGTSLASIDTEELDMAPVASFSQLLQGRAAGVNILSGGGKAGQASKVVMRGPGSLSQGIQPIIYVDGVRIDQTNVGGVWTGGQSWSTLDDINPADIERVEIVRGAAAATLYGTEASAGVIQIFTRRGRDGDTQITFSSELGANHTPQEWWNVSAYTPWFYDNFVQRGDFQEYNLSGRGMIQGVNYFVSGTHRGNTGVMPNNNEDYYSLRGNIQFMAGEDWVVRMNSSFVQRQVDFPQDANNIYGFGINGLVAGDQGLFLRPEDARLIEVDQRQRRLSTGASIDWTPLDNLSNRLTFGLDFTSADNTEFQPYAANAYNPRGRKDNYRRETTSINLDYVGTHNASLGNITFTTSAGFNAYIRNLSAANSFGRDFPAPGLSTVGAAAVTEGWETRFQTKTAGFFLQEQFGLDDTFFLTLGLRADGHSAFGEDYPYQLYPKIDASWVASEHGFWDDDLLSLRLRAAYGTAGRQPGAFDAVRTWQPIAAADGVPAVRTGNIGNPDLAPEVTHEKELGFDASLFSERLNLELTYYDQLTRGALINVLYPPSSGFPSRQLENVGRIQNRGFELGVNATVLDQRNVRWDASLNVSTNSNEILDLGDEPEIYEHWTQFHKPGYPIAAFHEDRYVMQDGEVVLVEDDYIGPAFPTRNIQLGSDVTFLQRFNFRFLFDHAGGHFVESTTMRWIARYTVPDNAWTQETVPDLIGEPVGTFCRNPADEVMETYCANPWPNGPRGNVVQPADFWRLREVTLSYNVPVSSIGLPAISNLTVYVSGRNLWRWLKSDVLMEAEANYASTRDLSAQDYFDTPLPRQFVGGIRMNF